ncbi:MAG TPA: serine hydrolase [Labilithrix sp.]|nr:serine hydrolase [Labilithrix sp.]
MVCLRSCTVALAVAMLALVPGCARKPYLHWQGGDVFGVFEAGGRSPSRMDCPGTTPERFACFAARARERVGKTSGALAVVADDGALLQTTTTEPGQTVPTTSETLFPLLSVTKMFTAATAVLLAERGVLDLHRPIASYLPELNAGAELGRVTLHQLMTHTAGLLDDPHHPMCEGGGALSDAIARAHLGAQPGSVFLYSNIGYALVGLVIERTTSQSFEEVVRERVILPMGMSTATFNFASVQVRGHPEGAGAGHRCRLAAPAGGLIASARDVARWARAMSEPATHPLGQRLVEALTTPYVDQGVRPGDSYGYGVGMTRRGDVWVYHHSGGVPDFSAFVAWVPARRLGAAAMMNATNAAGATPAAVVLRGLSVLLDLPDDWRANIDSSHRPLSAYVGTYVDRRSWLGRLRVRLEGTDRLAFDYLDGSPALLPPTFAFRFVPGEERARYVVTAVGVGERVADEPESR